jgi:hypothetical protein
MEHEQKTSLMTPMETKATSNNNTTQSASSSYSITIQKLPLKIVTQDDPHKTFPAAKPN